MARSLNTIRVSAAITAQLANTLDGGSISATANQGFGVSPTLESGTTANKADVIWSDTGRSITSGANDDLDLYDLGAVDIGAGAGRDAVGQSIAIAEVVAVLIVNKSTSTGNLLVGGEGTTAAWNSPFNGVDTTVFGPLKPGGFVAFSSPTDPAYAVADTSNHILRLTASGGAVEYNITILGRSA